MTVKLAPPARQQFVDANGVPYSGAKLFTYLAGSTTKQTTYTDSTGATPNTNPIVLDSAGRTPYGFWLTAGIAYKYVFAPATDTDPPTSPIYTEDNIYGINDTVVTISEWVASGATPTYVNATTFTLAGDQTTDFHANRRLRLTISAGTVYGVIQTSAYASVTTVTVTLDSGSLDAGLSAVDLSLMTFTNSALPFLRPQPLTTVASASTVTFLTTNEQYISGTTTINAFNGISGVRYKCRVQTGFTLTNSANLSITQTGANVNLVAGDTFEVYMVSATSCYVTNITLASGLPLVVILPAASTTEVSAGSITTKAVTPGSLYGAINFSDSSNPSDQTITSGGALTIAHGRARAPYFIQTYLVCQSAEYNWSAGDVVFISTGGMNSTSGANCGHAIYGDTTNIYVRFGSGVNVYSGTDKSTGAGVSLTNTKWKLRIRAWH